jgi:hypothetical protein
MGITYYERRQHSYHSQLESFHKNFKIHFCICIFILAPKFYKVFLLGGKAPLFSMPLHPRDDIYVEVYNGIQND